MNMPGHFAPGQPFEISARFMNEMLRKREQSGQSGGGSIPFRKDLSQVFVRNMTGANVLAYSVLALGEPVYEVTAANPVSVQLFFDQPLLQADKTDANTRAWGILQEPLVHDATLGGSCGKLLLSGITPARIKGPPGLGWCGIKADSLYLHTDRAAEAEILWEGESEIGGDPNGERNALVLIGQEAGYIEGFLAGDLEAPDEPGLSTEAPLEIWRTNEAGTGLVNTEQTVTVRNFDPTASAAPGSYCLARKVRGQWRQIWLGCVE
jgi:hypothetical protein